MESLFARHTPKRGRVFLMLAGSLLVHGGLVGIGALFVQEPSKEPVIVDWTPVDDGGSPPPFFSQVDVSPEPTVTPEVVEPTVSTPPPTSEDLVFAEPSSPTPRQQTAVRPAAATRNATNRPTSATNALPGNAPTSFSNGNSLAPSVAAAWVMPHPPYPAALRGSPATGATTVRITTDASGRISNVTIVQSAGNPVLDAHTVRYVRENWRGPANALRTTQFVYQLR